MTVKANIIWKRIHDTHSLLIDDTTQEFVATINTFKPDGSLATTKSWPFQTFMGCHNWFTRELAEIGIEKSRVDEPVVPWSSREPVAMELIERRSNKWPNGDKIKKGES